MSQHSRRSSLSCARLVPPAFIAALLAFLLSSVAPASAAPFVFIDPGHGGIYNHAHYGRLTEKQANLLISTELRRQLQRDGIGVGMTRKTDKATTTSDIPTWSYSSATDFWSFTKDGRRFGDPPKDDLQARCDAANQAGADIFVSVHNNASGGSSRPNGTETYASARDAAGVSLSKFVQKAVVEKAGTTSRGALRKDFDVIRWSNMPAVLVECAFMTNPSDGRRLSQAWFRERIARGIATGIERWLATNPFKPFLPRYAGDTPAHIAAAASQQGWPDGADTVLLASPEAVRNELACVALARKHSAPLLFVDVSGVPTATAGELSRLRPKSIIALTGLGEAFAGQAAAAAGIGLEAVHTIDVSDGYAASAFIAREASPSPFGEVVLVSDAETTEVVNAAAYSAATGAPLLLVPAGAPLPKSVSSFLDEQAGGISTTMVFGSVSRIPFAVTIGLPNVVRMSDSNPYRGNESTLESALPEGPVTPFVVSPSSPAEGLVAVVAAAHAEGGAVLFNEGKRMSPYTREWITNIRGRDTEFTIVGGLDRQPGLVDRMVDKARH